MTKQLQCWQAIRDFGPESTAMVALRTGLSPSYVKTIIRDLRSRGCIATAGPCNVRVHTAITEPKDRRGQSDGAAENREKGRRTYHEKAARWHALRTGKLPKPATELERCWPIPIPAKTGTGVSHD